MQLNDITGNLAPCPIKTIGDNWAIRDLQPYMTPSGYPILSTLLNEDGHLTRTLEACSTFDDSLSSVSGVVYGLNCPLQAYRNTSTASLSMGYGITSTKVIFNIRGLLAQINSTAQGIYATPFTVGCSVETGGQDGYVAIGYIDGEANGEYKSSSSSPFTSIYRFSLGPSQLTNEDLVRFHSIRFYNRVLSPAEIAHNSKIDKERFG